MSRNFLGALAAGLAAVALIVGLSLVKNRGAQVRLDAEVVKTRLLATSEKSSVAIFEVRLKNPSETPFVVKETLVSVRLPGTGQIAGQPMVGPDLDRLLAYDPSAGPRYNPNLRLRERVAAGATVDRTLAFAFEQPVTALEKRAGFSVVILDVDGYRVDFAEKAAR